MYIRKLPTIWTKSHNMKENKMMVFVGTYTEGTESEGIYACDFDAKNGKLSIESTARGNSNPSFLAVDASRNRLFAIGEIAEHDGINEGMVSSFAINPNTSTLTLLNQKPCGGPGPCHISVDRDGRYVLVANYGGGSVAMLPVNRNGSLESASCVVKHEGSSINPERQDKPYAHSINIDPKNRYALAADLGADMIFVYKIDAGSGMLIPNDPPGTPVQAGAGPRHLCFGKGVVYVINELDATICVFLYNEDKGTLEPVQTLPTLPPDYTGGKSCADIHISPDGRFLYGSNRGHDSIAMFKVDEGGTGKLSPIGHVSTEGNWPRNFAIDPQGRFLLAANKNSNDIVCFSINADTGMLEYTGHKLEIPSPVCLKFRQP